jgi:hypothetical protein
MSPNTISIRGKPDLVNKITSFSKMALLIKLRGKSVKKGSSEITQNNR